MGAVSSMCALAKKLSLSNKQEDLKSWSNLSSSAYLNQKQGPFHPVSILCVFKSTTFGMFNENFLNPQDLWERSSISPGKGSLAAWV